MVDRYTPIREDSTGHFRPIPTITSEASAARNSSSDEFRPSVDGDSLDDRSVYTADTGRRDRQPWDSDTSLHTTGLSASEYGSNYTASILTENTAERDRLGWESEYNSSTATIVPENVKRPDASEISTAHIGRWERSQTARMLEMPMFLITAVGSSAANNARGVTSGRLYF